MECKEIRKHQIVTKQRIFLDRECQVCFYSLCKHTLKHCKMWYFLHSLWQAGFSLMKVCNRMDMIVLCSGIWIKEMINKNRNALSMPVHLLLRMRIRWPAQCRILWHSNEPMMPQNKAQRLINKHGLPTSVQVKSCFYKRVYPYTWQAESSFCTVSSSYLLSESFIARS